MNNNVEFRNPLFFRPKSNSISIGSSSLEPLNYFHDNLCFQNDCNQLFQNFVQILDDANKLEDISLEFAEETKKLWIAWKKSSEQCLELKALLEQKNDEAIELQSCLKKAMQFMNVEKEKRKHCEQERDDYKSALSKLMKQVLRENQCNPTSDTKKLLDTFYPNRNSLDGSSIQNKLTSSFSSTDSSYIRFEEELDSSKYLKAGKTWKTLRNGSIVLTSTKVDAQHVGQYETSKVSTTRSSQDNENHRFHQKTVVVPEICFACEKKIKFGKTALKCKGCKAIYHTECKNIISPLCLNTNDIKYVIKKTESISYYAPLETPMIPNIIISCIEEVEKRGLEEEGLYTVSRNQDDIKGLKKKLLSSVETVDIDTIDVHVVTGCLKYFLGTLSEPLITNSCYNDFLQCIKQDNELAYLTVHKILSDLPKPNKDTFTYVIAHLQKVANSVKCKMPAEELAKIFGSILLGHNKDITYDKEFNEMEAVEMVTLKLIQFPDTLWQTFFTKKHGKVSNVSVIDEEMIE